MKKLTALAVTAALLLSALCLFTFGANADAGYSVAVTEEIAINLDAASSTDAPVVATGASLFIEGDGDICYGLPDDDILLACFNSIAVYFVRFFCVE